MLCVEKIFHKDAISKRKIQQRVVLLFSKSGKFLTDNIEQAKTLNYLLHLPPVKRWTTTEWTLITGKRGKSLPFVNEKKKCLYIGCAWWNTEILNKLINESSSLLMLIFESFWNTGIQETFCTTRKCKHRSRRKKIKDGEGERHGILDTWELLNHQLIFSSWKYIEAYKLFICSYITFNRKKKQHLFLWNKSCQTILCFYFVKAKTFDVRGKIIQVIYFNFNIFTTLILIINLLLCRCHPCLGWCEYSLLCPQARH